MASIAQVLSGKLAGPKGENVAQPRQYEREKLVEAWKRFKQDPTDENCREYARSLREFTNFVAHNELAECDRA